MLIHKVVNAPASNTATPAPASMTAIHCRFESFSPKSMVPSNTLISGLI
jgi:hypothetical protein